MGKDTAGDSTWLNARRLRSDAAAEKAAAEKAAAEKAAVEKAAAEKAAVEKAAAEGRCGEGRWRRPLREGSRQEGRCGDEGCPEGCARRTAAEKTAVAQATVGAREPREWNGFFRAAESEDRSGSARSAAAQRRTQGIHR